MRASNAPSTQPPSRRALALDSSAVLAVLFEEDESDRLLATMATAPSLAIGAPTLCETEMVAVSRFERGGGALVEWFLGQWEVAVLPFDDRHRRIAIEAFRRFGKGRRHPAGLNYGDCMTYATARVAGLPLLCTGADFPRTDLDLA